MSPFRLALRSLAFHWRTNFAIALGVTAATAVLTGALLVGDSMYGSLRALVLDRLGHIDHTLVVPQFFREKLADDLSATPEFKSDFGDALPAIVLQGTLENPTGPVHHRAGNVAVYGTTPNFWSAGQGGPQRPPTGNEIVLNQPLADQLHARAGDEVVLRLPGLSDVPADSPLGRKTETVRSRRFTVSEIIPAAGLGAFTLRPSQQLPLDAFTSLEPLQSMLAADGKVNAIFVTGKNSDAGSGRRSQTSSAEQGRSETERLAARLHPTLADYGLKIQKTDRGYFNITSDRMLLEPALSEAVLKNLQPLHPQPVFAYLANYILAADGHGKIPYSTIAATDFPSPATEHDRPKGDRAQGGSDAANDIGEPLPPLLNRQNQPIPPLADDEIVLNSWAADDLAAQGAPVKPGDTIELTYFEPDSTHGQVVETHHSFHLKDIAQLAGAAADRNFTPEVKGVTDEASIANWNPPFPYDPSRVRTTPPNNQDDAYWQKYRATPKAFVNLATGRKLWGSRFGNTTSIRVPAANNLTEQALTARLEHAIDPASLGFTFLPVKQLSLTAAAGTTPFAILFLAFSLFIIAASLLLISLLFKLGVETRATELGIELAVGFRRRLVRRIMLIEGALVAALGALAGIFVGIGYAWLMLVGLKTWWLAAISTPFLKLYIDEHSIIHGFLLGFLAALATIVWALRQTRRVSVRRLLSGQFDESRASFSRRRAWSPWIAAALLLAAIGIAFSGFGLTDEAQAGAFLTAGFLVLAALLIWLWHRFRAQATSSIIGGRDPLLRLAVRSAARNPLRSTLTIGLMAAATFLIVAVSAFQLDAPNQGPSLHSGDGSFALIAQTDQPIYQDLNSSDARRELGFSDATNKTLIDAKQAGLNILSLRVQTGDDASCLNLYKPRQPRILGVSPDFIAHDGFAWSAVDPSLAKNENPWTLLTRSIPPVNPNPDTESPIPVVLDENTAMYSLHLEDGPGEVFEIDNPRGGKIKLQVVGLLKNSIFQGDLIISQKDFLHLFPDTSGYRMFLITLPQNKTGTSDQTTAIADALETALDDYGFTTQTTAARLAGFFAVQNTYLATFRSLGGLGLLLGAFGLMAVQLRNIIERRGEFALMQAVGFRRRLIAEMVQHETTFLLITGLAVGVIAALVTLLPHLLAGGAALPWRSIATTLLIVLAVGQLAGLVAARYALRLPLLETLRGK